MTIAAPTPGAATIRRAERADLIAVHRIERATFRQPWPFRAFERFLGEPAFLVAEDGTRIVGYVVADVVNERGRELGHVKDIAVRPGERDRGIGSHLLERALVSLAEQGARHAKLEVRESNEGARRLYGRFGFERHHVVPGYYDDGEDALILTVDLRER